MHLVWFDFALGWVCLPVALPVPSPSHMRCWCYPVLPQVDAFYNFWYSFKSWREFPHPDEEDIEQARSCGLATCLAHSTPAAGKCIPLHTSSCHDLYLCQRPAQHAQRWC